LDVARGEQPWTKALEQGAAEVEAELHQWRGAPGTEQHDPIAIGQWHLLTPDGKQLIVHHGAIGAKVRQEEGAVIPLPQIDLGATAAHGPNLKMLPVHQRSILLTEQ